jgi:hypothetical protein
VPYKERPFSPTIVRIAAVAGVVLLGVAGIVRFWVTPAFEESFEVCTGIGDVVALASFVTLACGIVIMVIGVRQADAARSWACLLVAFAGFALVLLGLTGLLLYGETWGSEGCSD